MISFHYNILWYLALLAIYLFKSRNDYPEFVSRILFSVVVFEFGIDVVAIQTPVHLIKFYEIIVVIYTVILLFRGIFLITSNSLFRWYLSLLIGVIVSDFLLVLTPPADLLPGMHVFLDKLTYDKSDLSMAHFGLDQMERFFGLVIIFPFLAIIPSYRIEIKDSLLQKFMIYGRIYSVILILELIFKSSGNSHIYESIYGQLTNYDPTTLSGYNLERAGVPTLHGLTQEPSHLGYALLPYFLASQSFRIKITDLLFGLLSLFSGSFRLVVEYVLFIFIKFIRIDKVYYLPFILISFLVGAFFSESFSYFMDRLSNFIFLDGVGSGSQRINTLTYCASAFYAHPLFGVGMGSINCYSGVLSVFASLGIWGGICYFKLITSLAKSSYWSYGLIYVIIILLFSYDIRIVYSISFYLMFLLASYAKK